MACAPLSLAQIMASVSKSLLPPSGPKTLPITARVTPGATPIRVPFTSRPKDRPSAVCTVTVIVVSTSAGCEVLGHQINAGEGLMVGINTGIEDRYGDASSRKR